MKNRMSDHQHLILGHLIDQAGLAYLEVDNRLNIRFWGRGAQAMFGLDAKGVIGRRLGTVLPVDETELLQGDMTGQLCIFHINAQSIPVKYLIHYISIISPTGEKAGIALLVKDAPFSKDKAAPSRLRAGSHSMADILGFAPVGIFHSGMDGNLTMANSELAWMLGYESPAHLVEDVGDVAGQIFYDDAKAEDFMFLLMEAERVDRFRCRLRRRDGACVWALCYAMLSFDNAGRATGINGYAIDISETIRAEQGLQKANEELMRLSVLDGLTQIANRRQFDTRMAAEWQRHFKKKSPMSVILCDIDHFKLYNDTYGHQAGDDCLIRVAEAIDACLTEPGGLAARYGGEEFGVILAHINGAGAREMAERIRARVMDLKIAHSSSMTASYITLSLGVATAVPGPGMPVETFLALSDKALYAAKKRGRNQWVSG